MNKKANAFTDLIVWVAVAFCFAISIGLIMYAGTQVKQAVYEIAPKLDDPEKGVNATEIAQQTVGKITDTYESLKWITTMLLIGSILTVLLSSFLIKVHPVFILPYIFIMVIAVIISVPLANTYEELTTTDEILAPALSGFSGMNYMMLNLPVVVLIIGLLGGVLLFINLPRDSGDINPFQ